MAEERRKGASDRRRSRAAKGEQPAVQANEEAQAGNPNEAATFDADQLDESIRARQQEDRGEVF